MRFYPLFVLIILAIRSLCSLATPLASPWENVHSKHTWNSVPENWLTLGHPAADTTIDLHIALKAKHENALIDALYEVSSPEHPKYGRHLSKEQVAELVAPPADVLELVHSWLGHHDVLPSTISAIHGSSWLTLSDVPVARANDILNASYQLYQHIGTNETVLRTLSYGLPTALLDHVQTVAPTTHFGLPLTPSQKSPMHPGGETGAPEKGAAGERGTVSSSGRDLYYVTPPLLRWQYQTIDYVPSATHRNVLGVAGYMGEYPNPDDFRLFMNAYRAEGDSAIFTVVEVNGGGYEPNNPGDEASQNIQYTVAMAYPTTTVFYSTGGTSTYRRNDSLLSWLYYVLSRTNVPQTITTSYGFVENIVPPDYAVFVCNLIAMLGLRGASVLFSSGNDGVGAGNCLVDNGYGTKYVRFLPSFPSNCPWVTSVGGTTGFNPEVAASFSGGGFSNYFPRPRYQDYAVHTYLQYLGSHYHGLYNPEGRGFPDISLQAFNFLFVFNKQLSTISGTSCAVPTAASIISLLNDYLLSTGRPPLGFLNPWLYGRGLAGLNDVIYGSNPGCSTFGFPAIPGWDPVSGLGSLDFEKLRKILDSG